MLPTFILIAV